MGVRGAMKTRSVEARSESGEGRALRSSFPLGLRGKESRARKADGTMYSGRRAESVERRDGDVEGRTGLEQEVGDEAVAGGLLASQDDGLTDGGVEEEGGLNLAQARCGSRGF